MGAYESGGYSLGSRYPVSGGGNSNLKQKMDNFYQFAYTSNGASWQQASIDKRFKVGDQSLNSLLYGDSSYFSSRKFFFNLILKHSNMIGGFQRRNRKSTVALARNANDDKLAEQYSKVLRWCENQDGFQEYFSEAFQNAIDVGLSFLYMYPDYSTDPYSGDLKTDVLAYQNVLVDPYFTKQDLSDCQAIWRRRWVTKEQAKRLLPRAADELNKIPIKSSQDGRFPMQAQLMNLQNSDLFTFDEFHYRDTRLATVIEDPIKGESYEWEELRESPRKNDEIKRALYNQPWLKVKKRQIPTVNLGIVVNDRVIYEGPNLLNVDRYPMVPLLCYHEPDMQPYTWRFTGIIRNLRDAQFLYNRVKVIELKILESQINTGWIYPVDALVDPKSLRQQGEGYQIALKTGRNPSEIQQIISPGVPQSVMELSRSLADNLPQISGISDELLGMDTTDISGILNMARQSAGITTLQTILDKADYSQRLYGELRIEAVRKNFFGSKLKLILGEEPDPMFLFGSSQKYSIMVEEGNLTATQRQAELQQKLYFKQLGIQISDKSIIKSAYIADKKEITEEMDQQAQQQAQAQQAQAQQQQQKDNAELMLKFAQSKEAMARANQTEMKAAETGADIQEKQAVTEHTKMKSDLDLVNLMMKLEELDLSNIGKLLELSTAIKNFNEPKNIEV